MQTNDRDMVKELLKERIEDLCRVLLPGGRVDGRFWVSYNPVTGDYDRSSPEMKVPLTGDRGAWKDWRSGDKGDVIRLIEYVNRCTFREAMDWARDFLGLATMRAADRQALAARAKEARQQSDRQAEQARIWKIGKAEQIFLSGQAYGAGGVAEKLAHAYFEARRCPLGAITNLAFESLRFHPGLEYWRRAKYRREGERRIKIADGPKLPAILSAMRAPAGQVTAVHCTFLDPVLPKKIAFDDDAKASAKLMFGEAKGAVMRISHGPSGEVPELATAAHPLVICEGRETGQSLAVALPEARIWAAGSLSNMGNAPVWMDCASAVIVARDNNEGNRQAEKQLEDVLAALAKAGKPMDVIASIVGDDFNDLSRDDDP
jgi:hypothetical protein